MTDAEKNLAIALAISPEREGWAWKDCGWTWCNNMETGKVEADEDCPHCHGTGRIPVELHTSQYTLLEIEWAAKQEWWRGQAVGEWKYEDWEWGDWADSLFDMLTEGDKSARETAARLRDLVHAGIEAAAKPASDKDE